MRYAALLCVSAHHLTTYGSFIQAQLQKTFLDVALFCVVGFYFNFFWFLPAKKKYETKDEMAAQTDIVQFRTRR